MDPLAQHLMLRLKDGRVIAPAPRQRQLIAQIVLQIARDHPLLAFALVDSHLHLELAEALADAMELVRRIEISITLRLGLKVGFARAHHKPITDQGHLYRCFDYIMRQYAHHGVDWDPYMEASNLPDLLGMRLWGRYTALHVSRLLPRVNRQQLLGYLGVKSLDPIDTPLDHLVEATCAAAGLQTLEGTSGLIRRARAAAVAAAGDRQKVKDLATLLGLHRRTVERLRRDPVDLELTKAIRLQLALRFTAAPEGEKDIVSP